MKRAVATLLRVLLLPPLIALSGAFVCALGDLGGNLDLGNAVLPITAGFAACLGLCACGFRFLRLYVFGHELTHWVAAKLFLRETGGLRLARASGSVGVERPNIWIVLAPYFIPVYTLAWIGFWGVFRFFNRAPGLAAAHTFHAGLGFTYAFHIVLTTQALLRQQEDLRRYGRIFSLAVILCCNLALLFAALLIAGRQWRAGIGLLQGYLVVEWHWLVRLWLWLRGICGT